MAPTDEEAARGAAPTTPFRLDWRTLPSDVIWDRVYSKFLNTWILFIAFLLLLGIVRWDAIKNPFPPAASAWMGDVVYYMLYVIVGTIATIVILPFQYANGHDQFRKNLSAIALFCFPLWTSVFFTSLWIYKAEQSMEFGSFVLWMASAVACLCCFAYYLQYSVKSEASYMEKHTTRNAIYVRKLLSGAKKGPSADRTFVSYMHPLYAPAGDADQPCLLRNVTSTVKTDRRYIYTHPGVQYDQPLREEVSLTQFFTQLPGRWAAAWRDIKKNTPQLMLLGGVVGTLALSLFVGYTFKYIFIETKWETLYDYFESATDTVEQYIDSVFAVQSAGHEVEQAAGQLARDSNWTSPVNETYAREQLDYYLRELGYNISIADIETLQGAVANFSAAAQVSMALFGDFSGGYFDLKDKVGSFKDEYNELKWAWNGCLIAAVIVTALVAAASLVWPILAAANTRHNLRTGRWRSNRDAYVSKYYIHELADLPGIMFGVVIVSYVVFCLALAFGLFLVVYSPVRDFLWKYLKRFIVSLICAMLFKNGLVFLVFRVWQLDEEGRIKNFESFSLCFMVMVFFNMIYGIFGAALRLLLFFGYSFVANLRIDATMLPPPLWGIDSGFSAYNAYLLFEHETKNPIMRTAVELLASVPWSRPEDSGGLRSQHIRARTRWFLAYTLLHNPSLIQYRRSQSIDNVSEEANLSDCEVTKKSHDIHNTKSGLRHGINDGKRRNSSIAFSGGAEEGGIVMNELHASTGGPGGHEEE